MRAPASRNASSGEVKPALQSQQIHLHNNCGFVGHLINSLPVCAGEGTDWWCLFDQEMTQLGPNNSAYKLYIHTSMLVCTPDTPDLGMDGGEDYPLIRTRRVGTRHARLLTYWVGECLSQYVGGPSPTDFLRESFVCLCALTWDV